MTKKRYDPDLKHQFPHLSELMRLRGWERHRYWKAHQDVLKIENREYAKAYQELNRKRHTHNARGDG